MNRLRQRKPLKKPNAAKNRRDSATVMLTIYGKESAASEGEAVGEVVEETTIMIEDRPETRGHHRLDDEVHHAVLRPAVR